MVIQLPVQERRAQPRRRKYREPELRATGPTTSGLQPLIPSASSPVSRSLNHFPDVTLQIEVRSAALAEILSEG